MWSSVIEHTVCSSPAGVDGRLQDGSERTEQKKKTKKREGKKHHTPRQNEPNYCKAQYNFKTDDSNMTETY